MMYEKIKKVLTVLKAPGTIDKAFKDDRLTPSHQTKVVNALVNSNYLQEDETWGLNKHYVTTDVGDNLLQQIEDTENLDKVIRHLYSHSSNSTMEAVCSAIRIDYSDYDPLLEEDGYVKVIRSKDDDYYAINDAGKAFVMRGGYKKVIESRVTDIIEKNKSVEPLQQAPPNTTNIHNAPVYNNNNSSIGHQGDVIRTGDYSTNNNIGNKSGNVEEPKKSESKKTHWLQIVYWIIGVAVAVTALYTFFKTNHII